MARGWHGRRRFAVGRWPMLGRAAALCASIAAVSIGSVQAGSSAPVDLPAREANATGATGAGGLAVSTVDVAGTSLTNACLELWTDAGGGTAGKPVAGTARCDQPRDPTGKLGPQDGFVDGIIAWTGLPAGSYVVHETLPPALAGSGSGYEPAADTAVRVTSAQVTRQNLVHRLTAGLTLRKIDAAGKPLPGACFSLTRVSDGRPVAARCDGPAPAGSGLTGDGAPDGLLVLGGLTPTGGPTAYELVEVHAPDGYGPVANQTVSVSPTVPTELTIPNATGATGAGGLAGQVTSLELEIESTIEIRKLIWPVTNGKATAVGRIALEADGSGGWRGSGSLASTTTSDPAAGCPSIEIHGEGTYDWVVREAHAGPDVAAADILVNMDSGPANEAPDKAVTNDCVQSTSSTMNTWENLFFDVYRKRFTTIGRIVDGWTVVGGAEAWTSGGVVAEATWTGNCTNSFLSDCTDHTTFRLYGTATLIPVSPPPNAAAPAASASPVPKPSASPSDRVATSAPGAGTDASSVACVAGAGCDSPPILPIVIGGGVVIVLAFLAWLRFMGSRQVVPLPVEPPTLNAAGGLDPAMQTLAVGDATIPAEFDKLAPEFDKLAPEFDKMAPEFDKMAPEFDKLAPEFDKMAPEFDKMAPELDTTSIHDAPLEGFEK